VPQPVPGIAHVVRSSEILSVFPPDLRPSIAAFNDPARPRARVLWHSPGRLSISAGFRQGDLLSVLISYAPGWRASVNGSERRLWRDALSQIIVDPACTGPCTVELAWDGGWEMRIARAASWGAFVAAALLMIGPHRRFATMFEIPWH
jgi:hypothetical protein